MSKRGIAGVVLLVAMLIVVPGAVSASAAKSGVEKNSLVGSWDVTVMLQNPPPGVAPLQRSLATFTRDGGTIETAAVPSALRGASHGTWERIGRNLFVMTRVFFRFDPQTGAYLGTQKINATIRSNGEIFRAVSLSELRDPDGNVVLEGVRATALGARIHAEGITDLP